MTSSQSRSDQGRRYLAIAQQWLLRISRGELLPGQRLPGDREIAAQANVTRSTAREAMLALELLGVIEIRHGDGSFVSGTTVSLDRAFGDILHFPPFELIEARASIEPVVASLAATSMDSERLTTLRALVAETASMAADEDRLPEFVRLGLLFHRELAPGCGNQIMAGISRDLVDVEQHPLWTLINQQAMVRLDARETQVAEHSELLDAIEEGDPEASSVLMKRHVNGLMRQIFGGTNRLPDDRVHS